MFDCDLIPAYPRALKSSITFLLYKAVNQIFMAAAFLIIALFNQSTDSTGGVYTWNMVLNGDFDCFL